MSNKTDEQIVREILSGNPNAYAEIVARYRERAFSLVRSIIRSETDAEEALQEAFIKAYKSLHRFRGDSAFGTWFYRIVYNTSLTRVRSLKKQYALYVESGTEGPPEPAAADASPLTVSEEEEFRSIVEEELEKLAPKYSRILKLAIISELDYVEISKIVNMPVGTIKTRIHRGRTKLRARVLSRYKERSIPFDSLSIQG